MADHPASLDDAAIGRHLDRLNMAYPDFLFSREYFGRKGMRWVAQRRDRHAPGLRVAVTADLRELHAALLRDKERRHAR
jgi:hypothetical protein